MRAMVLPAGAAEAGGNRGHALRHFDGERYELGAWVVMPNHVHVGGTPRRGLILRDILHSWKAVYGTRSMSCPVGRASSGNMNLTITLCATPRSSRRIADYIEAESGEGGIQGSTSFQLAGWAGRCKLETCATGSGSKFACKSSRRGRLAAG